MKRYFNRLAIVLMSCGLPASVAPAAPPLPVPSGIFVSPGSGRAASPSVAGQTMNIRQLTPKVTLNWDSFNIGHGYTVNFKQPSSSATALNLIHQSDPVQIRGALKANGEVWLLNQNGIVFGNNAQVNVRGLVASTLAPTAGALAKGIAPPPAQQYLTPAFKSDVGANGKPLSQAVNVKRGAQINTNGPNGRVLLLAPTVTNEGAISAPDGQVALAAGSEIYIRQPDANSGQSGLIIEVGKGGTVTNGTATNANVTNPAELVGQVIADRGTATLVGLSVNQLGRVSANSAIRANGTVRLLARNAPPTTSSPTPTPIEGGALVFGTNSVTAANPDLSDTSRAPDASAVLPNTVTAAGKSVLLKRGSQIEAHGGVVDIRANDVGNDQLVVSDAPNNSQSRIVLEPGSKIDVSGLRATLDPTRNALTVKLQGAELKDRPVQRDGALRGKSVTVDVRKHGVLADGTPWVGTPLADLTNALSANVTRRVDERNSVGGTVSLQAQGAVFLQPGAKVDVSGGEVTYAAGDVRSTLLFRQGQVVDISNANPNLAYDGIFGETEFNHQKWGLTDSWFLYNGTSTASGAGGGYSEGRDAGSIAIASPHLALDGELIGATTPGLFQHNRNDSGLFYDAKGAPLSRGLSIVAALSRPFNQIPRLGSLQIGVFDGATNPPSALRPQDVIRVDSQGARPQYITSDVKIGKNLSGALGGAFDVIDGVLPANPTATNVNSQWFGQDKLGSLVIFSEGTVELPATTTLDLGRGGNLNIIAGSVDVDGDVLAPSGTISMTAGFTSEVNSTYQSTGDITIGARSTIDVSGLWINELPTFTATAGSVVPPRLLDGGSITLRALATTPDAQGLTITQGSLLRADGGGAVSPTGKLTAGKGGAITLGAASRPFSGNKFSVPFNFEGKVSAVAILEGGTLNLSAYSLCIGNASCATTDPTKLVLSPAFLNNSGFGAYDLTATGGAAIVTADAPLVLKQRNVQLEDDFRTRPSLADVRDFSRLTLLTDDQRRATDFSLNLHAETPDNQFTDAVLQNLGILEFQTGASIAMDPGARLELASGTRLFVDGELNVPAGTINITLNSEIADAKLLEFLPSQSLWLGPHAQLKSKGSYIRQPQQGANLLSGTLRDAGSINLTADSGYIVGERGALIDVTGVTALFDITPTNGTSTSPVRQSLASSSGGINFSAAEGILFDGKMSAKAVAPNARAGTLSFELDASRRNDNEALSTVSLPSGPRRIVVGANVTATIPAGLRHGEALPADANGVAKISQQQLAAAGFGDVTLHARTYTRNTGDTTSATGEIVLESNVSLSASRRLRLDSASIASTGGAVNLSAPYVALGNGDNNADVNNLNAQLAAPLIANSVGSLTVSADALDFVGTLTLNNWRKSSFTTTGDIRFVGVQTLGQTPVETFGQGGLLTHGDLRFVAAQAYPTTLTEYSLDVRDNPTGRVVFGRNGPGAPVLSVGGVLNIQAPFITQAGTLKAPLGTLALNAGKTLELSPGSLTSTSLDGVTALFGRIELGTDWVYLLDGKVNNISSKLDFTIGQDQRVPDAFPTSKIRLSGPAVRILRGAVIDERGGGDLLAYEFQPGLNGSADPLTSGNVSGSFAILPGLHNAYAPLDPQEQQAFLFGVGDSLQVQADVAGLSAGVYPLLPAHFALLPGAYLVTPQTGYLDLANTATVSAPGGGTIVAGRRVFANGTEGDNRNSGFLVRDAQEFAPLGKFDLAHASDFAGLNSQARPQDAGILQVNAQQSLTLGGVLRSAPGLNGRGARAEFAGDNIIVTPNAAAHAVVPGSLLLDANGLNTLNATSLVLGATSNGNRKNQLLTVTAGRIEVERGAHLSAPEIMLAANDTIEIGQKAQLSATGGETIGGGKITVDGDGALLRLSNGAQSIVNRTHEVGVVGTLDIAGNATLRAEGATLTDASKDTRLNGSLQLAGALSLGASRISLGDSAVPVDGLILSSANLAALKVKDLTLHSRNGIDIYGGLSLNVDSLTLLAPGIGGYANVGQQASITTHDLILGNQAAGDYIPAAGQSLGAGALTFGADRIELRGNRHARFGVEGFDNVIFSATERVFGSRDGVYETSHAMSIVTPELNVNDGADVTINAGGSLTLTAPNKPHVTPPSDDIAGRLKLNGQRITLNTAITLPGGQVELHATGGTNSDDVTLLERARIDVSGRGIKFANTVKQIAGGSVSLVADQGDVLLKPLARVNVSGAQGGASGKVRLTAAQGNVHFISDNTLASGDENTGGSIELDANSLTSTASIGDLLSVLSEKGFKRAINTRIRQGDINLNAGTAIKAHTIRFAADNGNLNAARWLDASGKRGGEISLAASKAITVAAGSKLDAHANDRDQEGGIISLSSAADSDGTQAVGGIFIESGATLDVSGSRKGGVVSLRLPAASVNTANTNDPTPDFVRLNGSVIGASQVILEGFHAYNNDHIVASNTTALAGNAIFDDATAFMSNAGAIGTGLGSAIAGATNFHLRPGIEIRSLDVDPALATSDLNLDAIWDLSTWRFNAEPGVLTLRAAGNLAINDILSDGFNGVADLARVTNGRSVRNPNQRPAALPTLLTGDSWSYRLVAGADFSAADSGAVMSPTALNRSGTVVGNIVVAPGVTSVVPELTNGGVAISVRRPILNAVRTGNGSIDIFAGGEITLGNRAAVIYTAGLNSGLGVPLNVPNNALPRTSLQNRAYPSDGGDIAIHAGGSIYGVDPLFKFATNPDAFPQQLVSDWLVRQGDSGTTNRATGWTVAHEYFEQGVAALGGGEVIIDAAHDIRNLSVSSVAIGRQVGGSTAALSNVKMVGGGDISVSAGRDILGGVYYVGKGQGEIVAGRNVGSARLASNGIGAPPLFPVLALQDSQITVTAGGALDLGGAVNPTFIPQGTVQKATANAARFNSYFFSYSDKSAVNLVAVSGDVTIHNAGNSIPAAFPGVKFAQSVESRSLQVYPALLAATSLRGNITIDSPILLYPSAAGNVSLLAGDSVSLNQSFALPDIDPIPLPRISAPVSFFDADQRSRIEQNLDAANPANVLSATPLHGAHSLFGSSAQIIAANGDIKSEAAALLFLARPASIIAGRDIVNLNVTIENTQALDISTVRAGRDILYFSPRVSAGSLVGAPGSLIQNLNAINVWGPGRLAVEAGRDIDLGTANGIVSFGNSINGALTGDGAAISVFAGLGGGGLDFAQFINRYFNADSPYLPALVRYTREVTGNGGLDSASALTTFKKISAERQLGVVLDAYFSELRASGRAAAVQSSPDYSRGYAAVAAMFPRTDYAGEIGLFFSQIFTVAGGTIDLLAPGGLINVGLATPPASFGISKPANQLGVVAEATGDVRTYLSGDFNVNESRVFAADGGDLIVWSNFGDIDAGRGARSAISVPANGFQFDQDGRLTVSVPPPIQGSGIRALTTTPGRRFGNVDLVTPRGVVNASEAGIESAGNITIAAVSVLGADNIKAGGTATGVPVAVAGVSASVAGAGSSAGAATQAASSLVAGSGGRTQAQNAVTSAPSVITVEFLGFGEG